MFQQAHWQCANRTLVGADCVSRCWLNGPELPTEQRLTCTLAGTLVPRAGFDTPCTRVSHYGAGVYSAWKAPYRMTWPMAMQMARRYSLGETAGQLAVIENAEQNEFMRILAAGEEVWTAGARDEVHISDGVFWAAYPHDGEKIFDGLGPLGGKPVDGIFSNFTPGLQPDLTGGGVTLHPGGNWCVHLFLNGAHGSPRPMFRQGNVLQKQHVVFFGQLYQ